MKKLAQVSFFVLAVAAVGCGGSGRPTTAPVSGKVTFEGKPVEGAQVTFMKEGAPRAAIGTTDAEGRYQLTTFETNDGAVLGAHKVTIAMGSKDLGKISADKPDAGYGAAMKQAASGASTVGKGLPGKYANAASSGLGFEVKSGRNDNADFALTP